jgi:CRP-like cAMP-binding protein
VRCDRSRAVTTAGEQIFGEGEACQGFFVIESGEVRSTRPRLRREQVLTIERAGDSAELPVFDGAPILRRPSR